MSARAFRIECWIADYEYRIVEVIVCGAVLIERRQLADDIRIDPALVRQLFTK
jgi:hypothetical protein